MLARLAVLLLLAGLWPAARAAEPPTPTERAMVSAVADGATFSLADGQIVRLAALDVPRRGERSEKRNAVADAARAVLESLVGGSTVALAPAAPAPDRYGRILAHVADAEGRWVQAELITRGLARVAAFANDGADLAPLLALEETARQAGRGLWALQEFRAIDVHEAARRIDSFQLVEGRVLAVERRSGRTFLNCGGDWRSDFTVEIAAKPRRQMLARGLDPDSYRDKMVRVRGWIRSRNGPLIELVRPEQIEVLAR